MGDSERRRTRESERFRQNQRAGEEFWEALEAAKRESSEEQKAQWHNEHVMRVKRNESERHYRLRKKEEEGKE